MKHFPVVTAILSVATLLIHGSGSANVQLEYDRAAIANGEIWRALTGHFTHFTADHLRWDLIAFIAFGSLVELRSRAIFLNCLGIAAVTISLSIGWFQPQFFTYRGLSGLDSALFTFVIADLLRGGWRERDRLTISFSALALAGFLTKCAYEICTGLALFVEPSADFIPVPLAHLSGGAVGIAAAFRGTRHRSRSEH